jgi:hypothetical protein
VKKRFVQASAVAVVAATTALTGVAMVGAQGPGAPTLSDVTTANTRSDGYAPASKLAAELRVTAVAQGSTAVENPSSVASTYGYNNDLLNAAGQPQLVPTPTTAGEAQKTEPDKNTYLVFKNGLKGADPAYDYGTHFLFQGHELGAGLITRINLDADAAHRVTVLATADTSSAPLADIDGSTWDPFAQRLLFTTENAGKPTYAATPSYPSTVEDVSGALGRGGYEGIQDDGDGNIFIVEDIGGSNKTDAGGASTTAKRPNSFIYRYVPAHAGDLHNGKLQVLQVTKSDGTPITFASQAALNNPDQLALHAYGSSFKTNWVTIHDTAVDGNAPFVAGDKAKAANGTPFKRPENGNFRPGTNFQQFFFTETGDTNATSPENATGAGGWGSLFKLTLDRKTGNGTISVFYKGDQAHTGLDNLTFLSADSLAAVEDAGDTLHQQRNALDSGYAFDLGADYSQAGQVPTRWLAEGRDPSATLDAANGGFGKNEGDNEITGIVVSDGDPTLNGILGAKKPHLFANDSWRWFYTEQHGDNHTYEVLPADHGQQVDGAH